MSLRLPATILGIAAVLGASGVASAWQQDPVTTKPKATQEASKSIEPKSEKAVEKDKNAPKIETATFGGGCFWCLEAFFERIKGVKAVVSGYAGGKATRPTYEMVCTGLTGHAEVVEIEYDANIVSYDDLLDIFWLCHNPTTLNEQGPDHGTQYRSVILYHNEEQRVAARKSYEKMTASRYYADPIVTELVPFTKFYAAEKYHQDYYRKNQQAGYCQTIITPKLRELQFKLNEKAAAKANTGK